MAKWAFRCRSLAVLTVLALVAAACGHNDNDNRIAELDKNAPLGSDYGEGILVGFSMDTLIEDRWLKDRDLFVAAVERMGAEVNVQAAGGDEEKQVFHAENLISLGVDILVVVPNNAEVMTEVVEKAHAAGIKVLSYDRLIKGADVDLYISFDNEKIGRMQAEAITEQVPKGNIVYIGGSEMDNNSHLLRKGAFSVLQPLIDNGDLNIIEDRFTDEWLPAKAQETMQRVLENAGSRVDGVISANDGMAGGIIDALMTKDLQGKVAVTGQDADLMAIRRIIQGTQTMTVYKPIDLLAETAAELAIKLARGEEVTTDKYINNGKGEIPSVLLDPIFVNQSNIDATVIADGFHKREDVYN